MVGGTQLDGDQLIVLLACSNPHPIPNPNPDPNPNPSPDSNPNPHPNQVLLACLWVPTVPLFLVSFSLAFTIWTLAVGMIRAASLRVR